MYKQSQRGFAIGIVVAIIAVLALLGGGTYVATKNRADIEVSTTTADMTIEGTADTDIDMVGGTNVDTSVGAGVNTNANTSGNTNVNVSGGVDVSLGGGSSSAAQHTVTYTNAGFQPSTINVKVGNSVTFVNKSSSGLWVASNNHPTHLLLPGFDAKASLGLDQSYTFTFTKPGSWTFHNHLESSDKGTVVVQ